MPRGSKKQRAEARELAQALGREKRGLCAHYARQEDARNAERSARAARSLAAGECDYAFGARVERQFLALARVLAQWAAERERRAERLWETPEERDAWAREDALAAEAEAAKGFEAAQLAITRESRANGVVRRWRDYGDRIEQVLGSYTDAPKPGAWVRLPWELGLMELEGLALPAGQSICIGHAPGDRKLKHRERAREIRFYHPQGDERDPEGDAYFRLIGHVPANLPESALRDTVDLLVQKWGEDPADWQRAKIDPDTGRPMIGRDGRRVYEPMFDRLAKLNRTKLKRNRATV